MTRGARRAHPLAVLAAGAWIAISAAAVLWPAAPAQGVGPAQIPSCGDLVSPCASTTDPDPSPVPSQVPTKPPPTTGPPSSPTTEPPSPQTSPSPSASPSPAPKPSKTPIREPTGFPSFGPTGGAAPGGALPPPVAAAAGSRPLESPWKPPLTVLGGLAVILLAAVNPLLTGAEGRRAVAQRRRVPAGPG